MRFNLSTFLPHLAALGIFIAASVFYFAPQFSGKIIEQGDVMSYRGMSQELRAYKEATGKEALWTNAMFGGMPAYQINTISSGNYVKKLEQVARMFIKPPAGQFIAAMVCFYILMVLLGVNPWLSIIGAIAFGFATNNLVLFEAGHETKLRTISYLPLVASGMLLAFRKRYLLGGILFGIGLGMDLAANHVQMTYYFFLTVLIWGVAELITNIKNQTLPHFGKAAVALIVGGLLALGSAASNLWVTYEYAQDTMRGEPILEQESNAGPTSSSEVNGLDWDYAMQWSNNTLDVFAGFIPGVVGGGSVQPTTSDSPYGQTLRRLGAGQGKTFDAPLYWGGLPFTSGPIYFGAIMVFFFLVGLFLVEGPVKWWLGLGTLFTILLSMGNNLEGFNHFIFDYFPLYNKFRTPNSVLSVTSLLIPILAILALNEIFSGKADKAKTLKALAIGGGISVAIALFFVVVGPGMFDFVNPRDAQQFGQADPQVIQSLMTALADTRADLMRSDAIRSLILVVLSAGMVYFFLQDKIKMVPVIIGLGVLTVFDLFGVGMRYLNQDDFKRPTSVGQYFAPRPVDQQILQDKDPHYRVYDATINTFNSAQPSYHHKTIGGYHAAKLQRFQDLIDRHITRGNQAVLNMLNTKYFIVPGPDGQPAVQQNPGAFGNAWLVDSIVVVPNANVEIDGLEYLPLDHAAVVNQEFDDYVKTLQPTGQGAVRLKEYRPDRLTYESNAAQEELAVFSEIWYGPNKGWQAYIDGQPVEHIRVNYALRGLKIPEGVHEIVFEFAPSKYYLGKTIATICSITLLLALLGYIGWMIKNQAPDLVAERTTQTSKGKKK